MKPSKRAIDFPKGTRFTNLTVIKKVPDPKAKNRAYFKCQCECGNKLIVRGKALKTGKVKSCGCPWSKVIRGDCRQAMVEMPENSIDALVCDPPYGLSKEPDMAEVLRHWLAGDDYKHKSSGFMQAKWDSFVPGPAVWKEAYRVLKPGGYLVAFFGTRTYDMGVLAIRLAGFEVRDSIQWIHGQGFPKSRDIGKDIDKHREDESDVERVRQWLECRRSKARMTRKSINEALGSSSKGGGMASLWTTNRTSACLPQWDQWLQLKALLGFGDEMDAEVWRLNGRKGQPGDAWQNAKVVGTREVLDIRNGHGREYGGAMYAGEKTGKITLEQKAPATEAAKQWSGWGTALKPSNEPIVLARKPLSEKTVAQNVLKHSTGALNIDKCRVSTEPRSTHAGGNRIGNRGAKRRVYAPDCSGYQYQAASARWPANILTDGSVETEAAFAAEGKRVGMHSAGKARKGAAEPRPQNWSGNVGNAPFHKSTGDMHRYGDDGPTTASRFFQKCPLDQEDTEFLRFQYVPKVSKTERNEGLNGEKNPHPTLKPTSLMQYLCRLVTPPGGTVLDPFCGSGSTGRGAMLEGFNFVGVELDKEYTKIARLRIKAAYKKAIATRNKPKLGQLLPNTKK